MQRGAASPLRCFLAGWACCVKPKGVAIGQRADFNAKMVLF